MQRHNHELLQLPCLLPKSKVFYNMDPNSLDTGNFFQMTQRLPLYAESLAKACRHDFKRDIIKETEVDKEADKDEA